MAKRKLKTETENAETTETPEANGNKSLWEHKYEEAVTTRDKVKFVNELIPQIMRDQSIAPDTKIDAIDEALVKDGRFSDEEIANITEPKVSDYNGKSYYGYSKLEEIKAEQLVTQREGQLARRGGQSFVEQVKASRNNGQSDGHTPF